LLGTPDAHTMVISLAHFFRDRVTLLANGPGLAFADRGSIDISEFQGAVLSQDDKDPGEHMSSASTDGLEMMLAFVNHLIVVHGCDLRVIQASDVSGQKGGSFEQVWASLGNVQVPAVG
jgi:hypothetical protein